MEHQRHRLSVGLERSLSLVVAKAAITLVDEAGDTLSPFSAGLEFGTRYRMEGWGQGLTMLTCFQNLLPSLGQEDRARHWPTVWPRWRRIRQAARRVFR